jgi:MFS family permease
MKARAPGFRQVLGVKEFRALWAAELFSIVGDQLAGVALAVLVYHSTSSAALTALTYALTFVPSVLGGALLSGLADRFPRRRVLVATDLIRAALAATMAVPGLPLPVLWVLVGMASMSAAPFKAAQLALLPQILDGERYIVGLSLRQVTNQAAQLAGFASAGLLLVAVEPHVALAANAATFLLSAALILLGVRARPAAAAAGGPTVQPARPATSLAGSRQLPALVILICLAGLFVVPEGIAAPYGSMLGVGSIGIGLLMAADPLGSVIGAWLVAHVKIRPTRRLVVGLAAASGVPLVLCAPGPGLIISIILWATSGALATAYLIMIQGLIVDLIPDQRRGRVMGRIATGLYASQGMAIVVGGIAAEAVGPYRAVAGAGLLGLVLALCVGQWWRPVARSRCDLATGSEHGLGESQSHVPVRHSEHLPRNIEGRDSDRISHVPVRHQEHLLHNGDQEPLDLGEHTSHIPVRHSEHLPPNGNPQQPDQDQHTSHIPVRHQKHLPPNGNPQQPDQDQHTSHIPVRHQEHLPPKPTYTEVHQKGQSVLTTGMPPGAQATSLWASAARMLRTRFVVGRTA